MRATLTAFVLSFAIAPALATPDFETAVTTVIERVVVPAHESFSDAATAQAITMERLCAQPGTGSLVDARAAFETLALAWSRIEMFRFGPARTENRFEKLFYWPDRKGRGLKQVQAILATEDETASAAKRLSQKSVAVQGLPALEFVLFGTGADALESGSTFRCTYGQAIASVVADNATALLTGWTEADGFADAMRNAGSMESPYQSHQEAVQDLLRAASEQVQIVRDLKISASIGAGPEKAKPKRAPFWRSDLTMATMIANLDGVAALLSGGLVALLPEDEIRHASALDFEMSQARKTLDGLKSTGSDWTALAGQTEGHQKLSYTLIPLAGAIRVIAESFPAALGLTLGFNSLDGD